MAVDILIAGSPKWAAGDYSVAEDSTPIDPSDTTGGVGQFTVSLPETSESKLWRKKEVSLADGSNGTTIGLAASVTGDGVTAQLTANSRMVALNVTRTAQPYTGSLGGAFLYYLSLVGLTTDIVIDASITSTPVTFAGWNGVVWDQIKALCAAYQVETSLVSNKIVLRPIRQRTAVNYRDTSQSWSIDDSNVAQSVEVYYQQGTRRSGLAYPLGGWNSDVQAYQVDAAETVTFDISLAPGGESDDSALGVSLSSITQPTCVASVDRYYQASSVYTVAGNDGLPIPPAQWTAQGGSVSVAINEDTKSLTLTIRGAASSQYAPYTIGMSSGDNTYYSSLRLIGDGVFYDRRKLTLLTGNSTDFAPTEIGATVDSPFLNTYEDAYRAGLWALAAWTGPKRSLAVATSGINRAGDTGSEAQYTMGEFNQNPDFAGKTVAQFNAANAGKTAKQFSDPLRALVLSRFENQAFGNIGGTRVYNDGSYYRIRTVSSITRSSISYSADADDIVADFNDAYDGWTAADFNAMHSGKSAGDFNARPALAKEVVALPVRTPEGPVVARLDLFASTSLFPAAKTVS